MNDPKHNKRFQQQKQKKNDEEGEIKRRREKVVTIEFAWSHSQYFTVIRFFFVHSHFAIYAIAFRCDENVLNAECICSICAKSQSFATVVIDPSTIYSIYVDVPRDQSSFYFIFRFQKIDSIWDANSFIMILNDSPNLDRWKKEMAF